MMKKKLLTKNIWYNWLINCIPEPIKKTAGGAKDKIMILFKTNTDKDYSKPKRFNNLYGGAKKPQGT